MEPSIKLRKNLPSGTIILNRPARRNALSRILLEKIKQALHDFHQERRVRAVILTGAGDAFCAGIDLKEMLATSQRPEAESLAQWHEDAVAYKDLLDMMLMYPKPIIAAVNGPAVAGGAGLVLASDIVVASKNASFGLPEARRGLAAGLVAPLLEFRVGGSQAARLLLTAEMITAQEAHRINVFHELVEDDLIWARAHELAEACSKSAPESLQLTKRMLNETNGNHLGVSLSAGAATSATSRTTEAAIEGLTAFMEKRPPVWK
jgi:methylglutaconyl-CoA hydratase